MYQRKILALKLKRATPKTFQDALLLNKYTEDKIRATPDEERYTPFYVKATPDEEKDTPFYVRATPKTFRDALLLSKYTEDTNNYTEDKENYTPFYEKLIRKTFLLIPEPFAGNLDFIKPNIKLPAYNCHFLRICNPI
jgi:hypothetical protein